MVQVFPGYFAVISILDPFLFADDLGRPVLAKPLFRTRSFTRGWLYSIPPPPRPMGPLFLSNPFGVPPCFDASLFDGIALYVLRFHLWNCLFFTVPFWVNSQDFEGTALD